MSERMRETNALLTRRAATDVNKEIDARFTFGDRVANRVAEVAGSWTFILSFIGVLIAWCILNTVAMSKLVAGKEPFDPFPFIFFNLILSIVAALQGPVIIDQSEPPVVEGPRPGRDRLQGEPEERNRNRDPPAQHAGGESAPHPGRAERQLEAQHQLNAVRARRRCRSSSPGIRRWSSCRRGRRRGETCRCRY